MSYFLKINGTDVISPKGPNGENWAYFNSFWIGCYHTIDPATYHISVETGYLAIYSTHDSEKEIPAQGRSGPDLRGSRLDFGGALDGDLVIEDSNGRSIVCKGLDYVICEDIECGNQAMQLHLLRFKPGAGVAKWIDDSSWVDKFDEPEGAETADGRPYWRRTCDFGHGPRYCHNTWRHRNREGLRSLSVGMPLLANSLFSTWLKAHHETFPDLLLKAMGDPRGEDRDLEHWTQEFDNASVPGNAEPKGFSMICQGAFTALLMTELMSDRWFDLVRQGNEYELCRELMRVASEGSMSSHSLRDLADLKINSVVPEPSTYAHEFFTIRIQ